MKPLPREVLAYASPTQWPRTNRRVAGAVFAASLPLFGFAVLLFFPLDIGADTSLPPFIIAIGVVLGGAGVVGFLLAKTGLSQCQANPQRERGRALGWAALIVSLAWALVAYPWVCRDLYQWRYHCRVMTAGGRASRIAAACAQYARDNDGKYPESVVELIAAGRLQGDEIIWPYSGTSPYAPRASTPARDWRAMQSEVESHCDFLYFGQGLKTSVADARTVIILALKPELAAPEFSIVSASGYGVAWNIHDLHSANDASNRERAKIGLPPIPLSSLVH